MPLSQDQPPVWFRGAPSPSSSWLWSCDNLGFQPCPGGLPSPAHSSANRPRSLCLTGACFLLGPSGHTGPDGSSEGGEGPAGVGRGAGVKGGTGTPVGRRGRRRDDRARGAGAPLGAASSDGDLGSEGSAHAQWGRAGRPPGARWSYLRNAGCHLRTPGGGQRRRPVRPGGRQPGAAAQCPRGPAAPRGRRPHPARRRRADVSSPEAPPPAAVDAQAAPEKRGRGEPARAGAASRALHPSFVRSRDEALAQMARRGQLPALGAACGRSPRSLSRAPSVF